MNSSSSSSPSSKPNEPANLITINEKVNLTKPQHQVLRIICDTYETSFSEYMQQALVTLALAIEEGNFTDALLEKIGGEDSKNHNSSTHSSIAQSLTNNDLDLLKKLQIQQV
jgi:hypothetical protein